MTDKPDGKFEESRSPLSDVEFLGRVMAFQDGQLSEQELAAFEAELLSDPEKCRALAEVQMRSAAIREMLRQQAFGASDLDVDLVSAARPTVRPWSGWLAVVVVVLLVGFAVLWRPPHRQVNEPVAEGIVEEPAGGAKVDKSVGGPVDGEVLDVRFRGASQAAFFGERVPGVNSRLEGERKYALISGMVELSFPVGATAIIEGPAQFRILGNDALAMDAGRCSVHAPDGAEGFRVETPMRRIVDRGTRFVVDVDESTDTDVQVVEGAADIYRKKFRGLGGVDVSDLESDFTVELEGRLKERQAQHFAGIQDVSSEPAEFRENVYRKTLPDRIVSYKATMSPRGLAKDLVSVSVQRGGVVEEYSIDEIIPVELVWFRSYEKTDPCGHVIIGDEPFEESRSKVLSDRALYTGVINPGGQKTPLTSDPVWQTPEDPQNPNTPGLAVRFQSPVVNGPGPDVVFFELQGTSNPLEGDAFHVSPLTFENGRRSRTIRRYDLTLHSSNALQIRSCFLYRYSEPIPSLDALMSTDYGEKLLQQGFYAVAVGIDLSDLGFADGEAAEGLWFQDAANDTHRVDPVFIGGLPAPHAGELSGK